MGPYFPYDGLEERVTERKIGEAITDEIVETVWREFPYNADARLRAYEFALEGISGLIRALKNEITIGVSFKDTPLKETNEESTNEEEVQPLRGNLHEG